MQKKERGKRGGRQDDLRESKPNDSTSNRGSEVNGQEEDRDKKSAMLYNLWQSSNTNQRPNSRNSSDNRSPSKPSTKKPQNVLNRTPTSQVHFPNKFQKKLIQPRISLV
jgi:hypothetical protein